MDPGNVQILQDPPLFEIANNLIEAQQLNYSVCIHRRIYFDHAGGITVIQLPHVTPR
ncbi:hypothetical protein D3C75_468630 [compost metagenome]